jgi:hypothetical protein
MHTSLGQDEYGRLNGTAGSDSNPSFQEHSYSFPVLSNLYLTTAISLFISDISVSLVETAGTVRKRLSPTSR